MCAINRGKMILLVDGSNLFICHWSANPNLDAEGRSVGGVVGFLKSLNYYTRKFKPTKIIICWDGKGGSQKRRKLVENYKSGRRPIKPNRTYEYEFENIEKDKVQQRIKLAKYLSYLPIYEIVVENIEADDSIAYLTKYFNNNRKVIVSTDKDFYQLLDNNTIIYNSIFLLANIIY